MGLLNITALDRLVLHFEQFRKYLVLGAINQEKEIVLY